MRLSVPRSLSRLRRLLGAGALLVGAAAPAALAPAPVHAAGSCTPQGVTVIVDFGALGGGVRQGCAPSAGKAAALFAAAGHSLTRVQSAPSAVCSVDAKPADPCPRMPPANAYWGLFWTNGSTSTWTYASLGVDSQSVPAGGSVAFAWQSSAGTRRPAVAAPVTKAATATKAASPSKKTTAKASAKPKPKTSTVPSASPKPTTTTPSATPTPSARPSASARVSPTAPSSSSAAASVAASTAPSTTVAATSAAAVPADSAPTSATSGDGGGLPGWVAPAAVIVVLAAGGGVAVARRRARG